MDQRTFLQAAMSPAGDGIYSPVQIQKLLFLIDKEIPELVEGPHFDFQPYHYGPFDKDVYSVLGSLAELGHVGLDRMMFPRLRSYALTSSGLLLGESAFRKFDPEARDFIKRSSEFVRQHTFSALVAAIYKAYPEMSANSVFQS